MNAKERRQLVTELRDFARAYPEDIFTPLTDEEREKYGSIITRTAAQTGRHFAPWFLKAAEALDQIEADERLKERLDRSGLDGEEKEKVE